MSTNADDVLNNLLALLQQVASLAKQYDALTGKNISSLLQLNLPSVTPTWVNGMSQPDTRGFVQLQAVEDLRGRILASKNPSAASYIKQWYAIQSTLEEPSFALTDQQKFTISANCSNARFTNGLSDPSGSFNDAWFAFKMTPKSGQLYERGDIYPDASAFGDDLVQDGKVTWRGPRIADLPGIMNVWYGRFVGA